MSKVPTILVLKAQELGLSFNFEFVPFSKSRNAKNVLRQNDLSLNWKVNVAMNRKFVFQTDYSQGVGHCFCHDPSDRSVDQLSALVKECEEGIGSKKGNGRYTHFVDVHDVLESLLSDADALNHKSFEAWACDHGYDSDSRSHEKTYRQCLDIGLGLLSAVGFRGMIDLYKALEDFNNS